MEAIRSSIQSMCVVESQLTNLHERLRAEDAQEVLKTTPHEVLVQTVDELDVQQHSLGILYILAAQIKTIPGSDESKLDEFTPGRTPSELAIKFLNQTNRFLLAFRLNHVQRSYHQFGRVCRAFVHVAISIGKTRQTIYPLQCALEKVTTRSNALTTLHSSYILAAIHSRCYFAAIKVLDVPIFEVDPLFLDVEDVLKYYYYGGMAYIGVKRFIEAKEFLKMALIIPARQLSAIAIESYKKFVLVSLILGEEPQLPKLAGTAVLRNVRGPCKAYEELTQSFFAKKDAVPVPQVLETHQRAFESSNNFGLAKQACEALKRQKIKRLTDTYLTLSLQDISGNAGLTGSIEAERYLLEMIERGEIHAIIDKQNDMVTFLEDDESYNSTETMKSMKSAIESVIACSDHVRAVDESLSADPQYLAKFSHEQRGQSNSNSSSGNWRSSVGDRGFSEQ